MSNVAAGPRQEEPLQDGMAVVDSMPAGDVPLLTALMHIAPPFPSAEFKQSLGNFVVPVTRFTHPQMLSQNSSCTSRSICSRSTGVN